jgi:hypothetical protein
METVMMKALRRKWSPPPPNLFDPPPEPFSALPDAVVAELLPPVTRLFLQAVRPGRSTNPDTEVKSHE